MKGLVINLGRESVRWAFQRTQGERLGLTLERLDAVTEDGVAPSPDNPHWQRWQRPLRIVEMATLLSHIRAWERVVDEGRPHLVLEDDAWLMPRAAEILRQAVRLEGIEHLSLETRGRKKLLGAAHPAMPGLRRLWFDRSGAAAYLLWPEGARKLIARAQVVPGLADAVTVECPALKRWQAVPAQAIQIDMAAHYGLTPPIVVESAISSVARPSHGGWIYGLRRLKHQLCTGFAQLVPSRTLCEVRPAAKKNS